MSGRLAAPLRILMVHWDGAGNLPPQRALSRALVHRGHEAHVLTHDSVRDRIEQDEAAFHPYSAAPQASARHGIAPALERAWLKENVLAAPGYATDLLAAAARLRPSIILVDGMLLTALHAAACQAAPAAAMVHSIFARALQDRFDTLWQDIAGSPGARFSAFLQSLPLALVFSYREFADPELLAPGVHHVGPVREAVQGIARRADGRPLVLASLSTGYQDQKAVLQTICDAMADLPVEALVTTGESVDPADLRVSGNVRAERFVPHDRLLPLADLVISHGGHGTVAAAAGAGVPLLCLPMGRDQPVVAARIESLGLGRTLSPDAGPAVLADTARAMLADPAQRQRSKAFAARVEPFGELERAADLVEAAAINRRRASGARPPARRPRVR